MHFQSQSDLALTYHQHHSHSAFFASWSATWSLIRAWVSPPRGESFPSASDLAPNAPPLPRAPYKRQVLRTWLLINAVSAKLQHHPHRSVLPSHFKLPSFFHPLLDGENCPSPESPIPVQPPSNSPPMSHSHRLVPSSLLVVSTANLPPTPKPSSLHLSLPSPSLMFFNPPLTRARRDSSMAPLSMDRLHGLSEFLTPEVGGG